jgi:Coiled-coil domain-containing protein 124 /Oxs1
VAEAAEKAAARQRMVTEESYTRMVDVGNTNRADDVVEATSVSAALAALEVADAGEADRHPERCAADRQTGGWTGRQDTW